MGHHGNDAVDTRQDPEGPVRVQRDGEPGRRFTDSRTQSRFQILGGAVGFGHDDGGDGDDVTGTGDGAFDGGAPVAVPDTVGRMAENFGEGSEEDEQVLEASIHKRDRPFREPLKKCSKIIENDLVLLRLTVFVDSLVRFY